MVDEMRRVGAVADEADKVLRQFNASLAEQVSTMQQSTSQMTGDQKVLVAQATESVAQLASASDRLAQLRNDATQTAEKLAKEFDVIDQRATATGQRLTQASETVVKNVENLTQATSRAEGQMLGASSSFREQLERIRTGVQAQIDDINRGLMQITAQLERTGNTLRSTTAGTVADVERISQRFDLTSKEAATQLVEKTGRMRGATEEVATLLSGFGDQLDVLLDRLSMAGDGIRRHEGDLVGQMQTALSHLSTVAERLETSRALASNVSEQTVSRLNEVVDAVTQQMQGLTSGSQTAAGVMRGISQIYGDQSQALNKNVSEAHTQVLTMNKSIDDMQQRTDRLRVSLKVQGEDLMNSLQQILTQLSTTGDALGDTVDEVLRNQAADELKKMG
jgi:ABC-type transporter Mla subunit MlaD